jgi:hypothetical protein
VRRPCPTWRDLFCLNSFHNSRLVHFAVLVDLAGRQNGDPGLTEDWYCAFLSARKSKLETKNTNLNASLDPNPEVGVRAILLESLI